MSHLLSKNSLSKKTSLSKIANKQGRRKTQLVTPKSAKLALCWLLKAHQLKAAWNRYHRKRPTDEVCAVISVRKSQCQHQDLKRWEEYWRSHERVWSKSACTLCILRRKMKIRIERFTTWKWPFCKAPVRHGFQSETDIRLSSANMKHAV